MDNGVRRRRVVGALDGTSVAGVVGATRADDDLAGGTDADSLVRRESTDPFDDG